MEPSAPGIQFAGSLMHREERDRKAEIKRRYTYSIQLTAGTRHGEEDKDRRRARQK